MPVKQIKQNKQKEVPATFEFLNSLLIFQKEAAAGARMAHAAGEGEERGDYGREWTKALGVTKDN